MYCDISIYCDTPILNESHSKMKRKQRLGLTSYYPRQRFVTLDPLQCIVLEIDYFSHA